jgi:hypothetical protein
MEIFLITICLVIFFLISFWRIDLGLAVLAMLLPAYVVRFKIGFLSSTFLEGCILMVLIVWLIKRIIKKDLLSVISYQLSVIKKSKFLIPLILFLFAATISIFVSPNLRSALGIWNSPTGKLLVNPND